MTEAEANKIARAYQGGISWPSLLIFTGVLVIYALVVGGLALGSVGPWSALTINTLVFYAAYTPFHEAIHGSLNGGDAKRDWINSMVGRILGIIFFLPFALHRATHLAHHGHTNNPEKDADHWVASDRPVMIALRCLTVLFPHYILGTKMMWTTGPGRRRLAETLFDLAIPAGVSVWLVAIGRGDMVVFALLGPVILAAGLLGFLFDWAVHHPHEARERFAMTAAYLAPGWLNGLMSVLYLGQNYHVIHHLYPRLPFHRYGPVFRRVRPMLEEKGVPIRTLALTPSARASSAPSA